MEAEFVYYVTMAIFTIIAIAGLAKNTIVSKAKAAHRVANRIENSLDSIDGLEQDINELEDSVDENSMKIDDMRGDMKGVKSDLGSVKKSVRAMAMYENGQLDKESIVEDLGGGDDMHKYFNDED